MTNILENGKRDSSSQTVSFAVTNFAEDKTLNCDEEAGCLALADVVATLIRELIRQGIIHGTIA